MTATSRPATTSAAPATPPVPDPAPPPPTQVSTPVTWTRRRIDRHLDRRITLVGLVIAIGFVVAAIAVALGNAWGWTTGPTPAWLPLHLALAGGAATAVAAVLPFFTTALAAAAPSRPAVRASAVVLVAAGAASVSAAVAAGDAYLGHVGGAVYIVGLVLVAVAALRPLRGAMGTRRPLVERAYLVALLSVIVSATLASAYLSGWLPILERWAWLKPAHGWLNVVGFLSLVIVATLTHLGPTVEGGRIRPRRSALVAVASLALGVPAVALGYTLSLDVLARLGALAIVAGGFAVPAHALVVARDRGRWTSDLEWHAFTSGSLRAASVWFAMAMLVAAGRVLWLGADPAAWSIALVALPLAVGWVLQVLVGAWSHLLPAVGPGDMTAHAGQRRLLGRAARTRLMLLNGGLVLAWTGQLVGLPGLTAVGGLASGVALVAAVALALAAIRGLRPTSPVSAAPTGHTPQAN